MQIVEYEDKYLEDVRDLLTELEEYIVSIDKDELDQVHSEYHEKMALIDLDEVNKKMEKVILKENINVEEFLDVIESVGFKTYSKEQVERALKNTMYMVKAVINNEVVGIGRVVGDFSVVCCLSDICVKPEYQKKGIGLKIVNRLKKMIEDGVSKGEKMQIELIPTAGNERFYQKAGFKYKPDIITGMYLWIVK